MVKITIILLVLYFFQFYISRLWGKNILPNLTNSQEPKPLVFAPWSRSRMKRNTMSRSRLGKKSEAGAANKIYGSPALFADMTPVLEK